LKALAASKAAAPGAGRGTGKVNPKEGRGAWETPAQYESLACRPQGCDMGAYVRALDAGGVITRPTPPSPGTQPRTPPSASVPPHLAAPLPLGSSGAASSQCHPGCPPWGRGRAGWGGEISMPGSGVGRACRCHSRGAVVPRTILQPTNQPNHPRTPPPPPKGSSNKHSSPCWPPPT
jgi:hypothetical protein